MDGIEQYTISELVTLLKSRGLSVKYRLKSELVERLRNAIGENPLTDEEQSRNSSYDENGSVFNDSGSSDGTSDNDDSQSTNNSEENSNGEDQHNNSAGGNSNGGSGDNNEDHSENPSNNDDRDGDEENGKMTTISFRDVEDALPKFGGASHDDVQRWINNFEKTAETCKWNEVQKYLFMRKLLVDTARRSVESDDDIVTYAQLVAHLQKEYKDEASVMEIHQRLQRRRKLRHETCIDYMFEMMKISHKKVDDHSVIRYVADGINDDKRNRLALYEAESIEQLKKKLKAFDAIHKPEGGSTKSNEKKSPENQNGGKNKEKHPPKQKRCYNCGETSHKLDECPDKGKGKRCYNCGAFGHISKDCRRPKKSSSTTPEATKPEVVLMQDDVEREMTLPAQIGDITVHPLVDTGCPWTLLRYSTYKRCRLPHYDTYTVPLKGFDGRPSRSLGSVEVTVKIDNEFYTLQCHLVWDNSMSYEMLLGRDWLKQTRTTFVNGKVQVAKLNQDIPDIFLIEPTPQEIAAKDLPAVTAITSAHERNEIIHLIENYAPKQVAESCIKMQITMTDPTPVYQNPRRMPERDRLIVQQLVDEYLADGTIRPSKSPYASPILLKQKPNGTHRMCVDYRKVNERIAKDRYPLPLMEDVIESIHDQVIFSSIDLRNGFFHVDVEEESKKYTAFITPDGQYEFNKAPFGLCNSPAVFQRYINTVFREAQATKLVRLYLDDVLIPSTSVRDNLEKVKKVFQLAADNGLKINFQKCKFFETRIKFLGFIIEGGKIRPSHEKTKAIQAFPLPRTPRAVQSFLGLTGFFRKFIDQYATIARPLSDLLRDGVTFKIADKQIAAFEELKRLLCSAPVLRLYNPKAATQLHTDASKWGYGGCLMQKQNDDGQYHPVYYLSFKTTEAEEKLHSYELEVLAIMKCLERLRTYLLGIKFEIFTDCESFQQTMRKKTATAKVARWALQLEEYDIEVKHRPGRQMKHVDALSRMETMLIDEGILQTIRNAQKKDDECQVLTQLLEKGPHKNYVIRDGIIYDFDDGYYRLKVPHDMVNSVLTGIHGDNHISRRRMEMAAKQEYQIKDLAKRIDAIVNNCITCILATRKNGKKDGWLHPLDKHDSPLHTYHIDHLGPLTETKKKYNYILLVVDGFTKFTWLHPTKSTKCAEAIEKLRSQQTTFGNPRRIIADKGSAFIAKEFETYCTEEDINLHLVTTATPRGNGQAERMNRTIIPTLTKLAIDEPTKWFKFVPHLQRAINSAVTRTTKTTPFRLMFGIDMKNNELASVTQVIQDELINSFDADRSQMREMAACNILKVQDENQRTYNKNRKDPQLYTVGDLVAIEQTQYHKGRKIHPKMLGPYEVVKVGRNERYHVQKVGSSEGPNYTSVPAERMKQWAQ